MIPLDKIGYCTNPNCRLVLPADPENPKDAGFTVAQRKDGLVIRFEGRCRGCVADRRRRQRGAAYTNHLVHDGVRDGKVVRLKVCRRCGREKVCEDGPGSEFAITARRKPGYSAIWNPLCKACKNETHKKRMATDPAYAGRVRANGRKNHARWKEDPANLEKARKASRRAYRARKQRDPESVLEAARMGYVLRQERKGKTVRPRRTVIDGTRPTVPAEPFRRYLIEYDRLGGFDGNSEALAAALGIGIRRVGAIMRGEYKNVALDVVDRALLDAHLTPCLDGRAILTLDDLYPYEEAA